MSDAPHRDSPSAGKRPGGRHPWKCPTELDARGRQPPRPLEAIRSALCELAPGDVIYLRSKPRPDELLAALARLGIPAASVPLLDESWRTTVWRT